MFDAYLALWGLTPDGEPIITRSAHLLPVLRAGEPAMLRIAVHQEAKGGDVLLRWWGGLGAVRLIASDGDAVLIERALGPRSLSRLSRSGGDDEATRIICDVIGHLHAPRGVLPQGLIPLETWFEALWPAGSAHGGLLARAADAARGLFASPQDLGVLHGDIHHGNILDFGARGWLAIDPNRLMGERGFDYANLFCNPDMEDPSHPVAVRPERFRRRLAIVSERARLERKRLLSWVFAYAGLSAAWLIADGDDASVDFAVAALAVAEMDH